MRAAAPLNVSSGASVLLERYLNWNGDISISQRRSIERLIPNYQASFGRVELKTFVTGLDPSVSQISPRNQSVFSEPFGVLRRRTDVSEFEASRVRRWKASPTVLRQTPSDPDPPRRRRSAAIQDRHDARYRSFLRLSVDTPPITFESSWPRSGRVHPAPPCSDRPYIWHTIEFGGCRRAGAH